MAAPKFSVTYLVSLKTLGSSLQYKINSSEFEQSVSLPELHEFVITHPQGWSARFKELNIYNISFGCEDVAI